MLCSLSLAVPSKTVMNPRKVSVREPNSAPEWCGRLGPDVEFWLATSTNAEINAIERPSYPAKVVSASSIVVMASQRRPAIKRSSDW